MIESLKFTKADTILKRTSLIAGYFLTIFAFSLAVFNGSAKAYAHFAKQEKVNALAIDLNLKYQNLENRLAFSITEQKESAFRTRAMDMRSKYGSRENMSVEQREIYDYWIMEADKYKSKMHKLEEKDPSIGDG